MADIINIRMRPEISGTIEICRSFGYKLNVGNYESRDFFCSMKASCAAEDAEEISRDVDEFVEQQVLDAVKDYRRKIEAQRERKVG